MNQRCADRSAYEIKHLFFTGSSEGFDRIKMLLIIEALLLILSALAQAVLWAGAEQVLVSAWCAARSPQVFLKPEGRTKATVLLECM
ncbi:hypothetical protein DPX16_1523 [Anabarilius grahami]|uniref:Uncharacterized protein n=1 Tax=Anabarilius grahami TaxID=495550 RepID=A0A3N0Y0F5_ANAGA|nr:hypothetical protein DPX16_1523 [Anabarilius grahami]